MPGRPRRDDWGIPTMQMPAIQVGVRLVDGSRGRRVGTGIGDPAFALSACELQLHSSHSCGLGFDLCRPL